MYEVKYQTVDKNDRLVEKVKSFRTAQAREKFVENDENLVRVTGWRDPKVAK